MSFFDYTEGKLEELLDNYVKELLFLSGCKEESSKIGEIQDQDQDQDMEIDEEFRITESIILSAIKKKIESKAGYGMNSQRPYKEDYFNLMLVPHFYKRYGKMYPGLNLKYPIKEMQAEFLDAMRKTDAPIEREGKVASCEKILVKHNVKQGELKIYTDLLMSSLKVSEQEAEKKAATKQQPLVMKK